MRRSPDLPARSGGEQFAVVLPGPPAEGAGPVAEAVRTLVPQLRIPRSGSATSAHVSVSVGIATVAPGRSGPERSGQPESLAERPSAA